MFVREGVALGGKEFSIEVGRMAKQADGAVVVRFGDSMVLVTAVGAWQRLRHAQRLIGAGAGRDGGRPQTPRVSR